MLAALVPVLMILVGILMYALCANPKLQKIGEWMFAAGFFAVAFAYSAKMVTLLHG